MGKPLLTVLMPVYNAEKYLSEAIESVLNQTFTDFEFLIINDGSTDKSEEIILSYDDKRIRYFKQENMGVAATLNKGLELTETKYLRRVDADDIIKNNALEKQIDFFDKTSDDIAVVAHQICFMTENGKIAKKFKHPNDDFFENKPYKFVSFEDYLKRNAGVVVHATTMFDVDFIKSLGGYRSIFRVSEDDDLWLRVLDKKKIVILNECLYYVRIHSSSATQVQSEKIAFFWNLALEMAKQRRELGSDAIQRGEEIHIPEFKKQIKQLPKPDGKLVRRDLNFIYSLVVNAKDFKLIKKYATEILKYGWKKIDTYKLLLFPVLGDKIVKTGVKLKKFIRRK